MDRFLTWVSGGVFLAVLSATGGIAEALSFGIYGYGGVFQVPASQHYAAGYGASVEVASRSGKFAMRANYIERPVHEAQGFEDQDSLSSLTLGGQVSGGRRGGLNIHMGYGVAAGYVKAQQNAFDQSQYGDPSLSYQMHGLDFQAEGYRFFGGLKFGLGHRLFVGLPDAAQLDASVAYTFSSFLCSLGYIY